MKYNTLSAADVESSGFRRDFFGRRPRRAFLADMGLGFTGLALGAMLQRDGLANGAA